MNDILTKRGGQHVRSSFSLRPNHRVSEGGEGGDLPTEQLELRTLCKTRASSPMSFTSQQTLRLAELNPPSLAPHKFNGQVNGQNAVTTASPQAPSGNLSR